MDLLPGSVAYVKGGDRVLLWLLSAPEPVTVVGLSRLPGGLMIFRLSREQSAEGFEEDL